VINGNISINGSRLRNGIPHSLRVGPVTNCDVTPGHATTSWRLHLLATYFGGPSSDQPLLLFPFVERDIVRKRADSTQCSDHTMHGR